MPELGGYQPSHLLLQWHITERCNLRCAHCYQEPSTGDELSLQHLLEILEQFKDFLQAPCAAGGPAIRGHITVTGGEPFVRRDFPHLLEILAAYRDLFSFAILTNGTLIDAGKARWLRELEVRFVQVSLEGSRATHDRIRGRGNFERTVAAVKHLGKAKVRTLISFTAHRGNYREFGEVARLGRRLGVARVWADRLIPSGSGTDLQDLLLTPDETREFVEILNKARAKTKRAWFLNRTEIGMRRALQFLGGGGRPYHCTAGDTLVTVMPNGDLYPCRRMPIRVGSLLETPLSELYHCDLFQDLRDPDHISANCQNCFYARLCRGGLRCLSYSVFGDPFRRDPGCWIASRAEHMPLQMFSPVSDNVRS
jgi:radical SAM protein with 4Fe4S-binding SPASM domain